MNKAIYVLFLLVSISLFSFSQEQNSNLEPLMKINIDSNSMGDTLKIYMKRAISLSENINGKIIKKYRPHKLEAKSDSIIYLLDHSNDSGFDILKVNLNENHITKINKKGTAPGDFLNISDICTAPGKYLYVVDNFGKRVQKFDNSGNYISTIYVNDIFQNYFCISKDLNIISKPKNNDDLFLGAIFDDSGKEINKIAPVEMNNKVFFTDQSRRNYFILANQSSNYIWFVSALSSIIRKYDYDGKFLNEYNLSNLHSYLSQSKKTATNHFLSSPITEPKIVSNEQLLVLFNGIGWFLVDMDTSFQKAIHPIQFVNKETNKIISPIYCFYSNGHYYIINEDVYVQF